MNTHNKKILFLLLTALALQLSVFTGYNGLMHLSDGLKSFFASITPSFLSGGDKFSIVKSGYYNKYIRVYSGLPADFMHSGHLLFYSARRDISIRDLAETALPYTHFYKKYQLEQAIREYNGMKGDIIKKNKAVYIPYSLPALLADISKSAKPPLIFSRGLYFTGNTAGNERILERIDRLVEMGINTIVFDAKDVCGIVNYHSQVPLALECNSHEKRTIDDIDKLIRGLKERGIYIIARIAVFHDHMLYRKKPECAVRSKKTGKPWNLGSAGDLWCDPTSRQVQDYNIALAIELADKGVDEIQFDYIRFPTNGDLDDARYAYSFGYMSNEDVISHFLKRAYSEISRRNTWVSIDIFGVVAWGKEIDIVNTGQRIEQLSRSCDIISPMLYPSHFNDNFQGFENPGDNPYYFIYNGCLKVQSLAPGCRIRPWLQAFPWRTSAYNPEYIIKQIDAARDARAYGFLFWNAANTYDTVYAALFKMTAHPKKEVQMKNASSEIRTSPTAY